MKKIVTLLILLSRFPLNINTSRACTPNSRVVVEGKICQCNNEGQWTEAKCQSVERQACRPGQVVFQGCNRCVCQENGQLACSEESCANQQYQSIHESFNALLPWCNPFRTYYISCNICVCPASGKTTEANCVVDVSCTLFKEPTATEISSKLSSCIPKVMYLFPCMHCLCSDDGLLTTDKCIETCAKKEVAEHSRRCIPGTLYRRGCNVCRCPENSFPDDKLCTKTNCTDQFKFHELQHLRGKAFNCTINQFTKPRCIYCDCNADGAIDEKNCIESECLSSSELKFNVVRETCNPGEMVPFCVECLCPRNGVTSDEYCTEACSYQSKVQVLEKILIAGHEIAFDKSIKRTYAEDEKCDPNTVYFDRGKYCICPDTGNTNFNLCSAAKDNPTEDIHKTGQQKISINFSVSCEPNTLVDFDCNTCFCAKNGKIDPRWCTYDDCEAKRAVQDLYEKQPNILDAKTSNRACIPGSISKVDCNFCICPDSGQIDSSACTKNDCAMFGDKTPEIRDKLSCEPMAYYEVDCNVCFCPRDGLKNVARCTKNHCEKGYLRTDVCVPGQLFSEGCNVCVCPLNGNKSDKACTKSTCNDAAPWKKIFQLSESLLGNQVLEDATRNLDLCFPGEEYVAGCKLCMCPDMGLRYYAVCSPTFCEEDRQPERLQSPEITGSNRQVLLHRRTASNREECHIDSVILNNNQSSNRPHVCTPGSMYTIKCQQCICPYMGDVSDYCRTLPEEFECEKTLSKALGSPINVTSKNETSLATIMPGSELVTKVGKSTAITHRHTRYECERNGRYTDLCFVCECEKGTLIAEHCFRSNAQRCANATPTFLSDKPI